MITYFSKVILASNKYTYAFNTFNVNLRLFSETWILYVYYYTVHIYLLI